MERVTSRLKQQPVRARSVCIGHTHTARVENTHASRLSLKLRMRVSANDDLLLDASKDTIEPFLRSDRCKDLLVTARRSVAEHNISQALNVERHLLRQLRQEIPLRPL